MFGEIIPGAVFVIVLIVCLHVLPEMGFEGKSRATLAFCVAVLSAMGMAMLGPAAPAPLPNSGIDLDFMLLPYAALGLSLLLLFLLLLVAKFWGLLRKLCGRYTERPRLSDRNGGGLKRRESQPNRVREERGSEHTAERDQSGRMAPRRNGDLTNQRVPDKDNRRNLEGEDNPDLTKRSR